MLVLACMECVFECPYMFLPRTLPFLQLFFRARGEGKYLGLILGKRIDYMARAAREYPVDCAADASAGERARIAQMEHDGVTCKRQQECGKLH